LTNSEYSYRGDPIKTTIREVGSSWNHAKVSFFLKLVFAKASREKQIPVKYYLKDEDEIPLQTTSVSSRLL
jgi:hypothetical protein